MQLQFGFLQNRGGGSGGPEESKGFYAQLNNWMNLMHLLDVDFWVMAHKPMEKFLTSNWVFDRLSVAGAVLQTALSLIHSFTE